MKRRTLATQVREKRPYAEINKKMVFIVLGLSLIFIFVQFLKLSTVGRIGQEIAKISHRQEELELENEILKSKISELKAPSYLQKSLEEQTDLVIVQVKTIQPDQQDNIAINE